MNTSVMQKGWSRMSEEIISGMAEWRQQNPKAKFREIEAEVDKRLSGLRARMLADAAMSSAGAEWETGEREIVCPDCGEQLVKKGYKETAIANSGRTGSRVGTRIRGLSTLRAGDFPP